MLNSPVLRYQFKRKLLRFSGYELEQKKVINIRRFFFLAVLVALALIASCIHSKPAHANETVDNQKAIYAIIGEAENQGFMGMLAVAHAIRNRGTLHGVYGLSAPRVKHHLYTAKTYTAARQAWEQSAIDFDLTHGATHWENIKVFGCPSWVKNCVETFRHKDHVFYREAI